MTISPPAFPDDLSSLSSSHPLSVLAYLNRFVTNSPITNFSLAFHSTTFPVLQLSIFHLSTLSTLRLFLPSNFPSFITSWTSPALAFQSPIFHKLSDHDLALSPTFRFSSPFPRPSPNSPHEPQSSLVPTHVSSLQPPLTDIDLCLTHTQNHQTRSTTVTMPAPNPNEQFAFLITCIKYSAGGKVSHPPVDHLRLWENNSISNSRPRLWVHRSISIKSLRKLASSARLRREYTPTMVVITVIADFTRSAEWSVRNQTSRLVNDYLDTPNPPPDRPWNPHLFHQQLTLPSQGQTLRAPAQGAWREPFRQPSQGQDGCWW